MFEPAVNVRMGTFYLTQLLGRFQSQPLAIAAYNAGPEAVAGWVSSNGELDPDSFVESIPYGETRRYLRRVTRSYRMYRLLYGGSARAAPKPTPEPPEPAP